MSRPILFTLRTLLTLGLTLGLLGCGSGHRIPGLEHFSLHAQAGQLTLGFLATSLHLEGCASFAIPGVPGATLGCSPDLQGHGTVFQLSLPLRAVSAADQALVTGGLPDGRALPDVLGGVMPRWSDSFGKLQLTFYVSGEAFGLFVPVPLKTPAGLLLHSLISVRIRDERGNLIGKAYAIPPGNRGEDSGLFLLLPNLGQASQAGQAARATPLTHP